MREYVQCLCLHLDSCADWTHPLTSKHKEGHMLWDLLSAKDIHNTLPYWYVYRKDMRSMILSRSSEYVPVRYSYTHGAIGALAFWALNISIVLCPAVPPTPPWGKGTCSKIDSIDHWTSCILDFVISSKKKKKKKLFQLYESLICFSCLNNILWLRLYYILIGKSAAHNPDL